LVAVVFAAHGQTSGQALGVALLVGAALSAAGASASFQRTRYRLPAA
jgi:hypothetical protein